MTPSISVVVLNYNGRAWLGPCLDALAAQTGAPPFETVLVDNASSDGSTAFVAERYPSVRIVETGSNRGFAGGNNAGARAARGTQLAFLNNDTVAAPDWLSQLNDAALRHPDAALITSRVMFLKQDGVVDSAGDGYFRAGGAYKRGHGAPAAGFLESREVFGACGAAFMIRRDVFESLGGFDERFFMVYEDVDLSYRARLAGHRCWYAADAVVRHVGSGSLGVSSDDAVFYGQRNLEWTWFANTPGSLLIRTLPAHIIYSLSGVIHYTRRGRGLAAVAGKLSALGGLPFAVRKRSLVQRDRRLSVNALEAIVDRGWIAAKHSEKGA
jgi:N-acetylglucosaminyl-diphospho-decaprenol L-rhamnosyltransferase